MNKVEFSENDWKAYTNTYDREVRLKCLEIAAGLPGFRSGEVTEIIRAAEAMRNYVRLGAPYKAWWEQQEGE